MSIFDAISSFFAQGKRRTRNLGSGKFGSGNGKLIIGLQLAGNQQGYL